MVIILLLPDNRAAMELQPIPLCIGVQGFTENQNTGGGQSTVGTTTGGQNHNTGRGQSAVGDTIGGQNQNANGGQSTVVMATGGQSLGIFIISSPVHNSHDSPAAPPKASILSKSQQFATNYTNNDPTQNPS